MGARDSYDAKKSLEISRVVRMIENIEGLIFVNHFVLFPGAA